MEGSEKSSMTSLADYASAPAARPRGPSPVVAALLTLLTPGLGHIYIGQARRGILLFALVIAADVLLMFSLMGVLARFWMFAVSLALLIGLWLLIMIDAASRARRMREASHSGYSRFEVYASAFVVAWLIAAIPCFYAFHASSSGQLGVFPAITSSMEPTLRAGEFFFADATYYRSHKPSRGEVVVYVHPHEPGRHYIKRIVAVEGDRIAVKAGHAIVNGTPVEEPYVLPGTRDAPYADMPETRVAPGHIFVLGDNRAHSVDSRDTIAHGQVPVANLVSRVTDIAFSRVVTRMGRWIGTPSM
jgi:signal peptidase I